MNKSLLLAAASAIALCAGGALAADPPASSVSGGARSFPNSRSSVVLYNQNSNDAGDFVSSQNFTSGSTQFDAQGADDFVIPKGRAWEITEVDVSGVYFVGHGPATSENVIFYRNRRGKPGSPVKNGVFANLNGTGGPNFALVLPGRGIKLKPGRYWVSVVENADEFYQGAWGWEVNSTLHGEQAMWQNPGGYYGECNTWEPIDSCYDLKGPDLMFELKGKIRQL